jgi:hypothetical protein
MTGFITNNSHQILTGNQIKKDKMDEACGTHGGEACAGFSWEKHKKKDRE